MMQKISASDSTSYSQSFSADQLFSLWSTRYLSSTSSGTVNSNTLDYYSSSSGRQRTVEKLLDNLVEENCKRAAIRTKDLYAHYKNLDLKEIAELARFACQIYPVMLEFYLTHTPKATFPRPKAQPSGQSYLTVFSIPEIHTLASLIEPFLLEFQSRDIRSRLNMRFRELAQNGTQ